MVQADGADAELVKSNLAGEHDQRDVVLPTDSHFHLRELQPELLNLG